MNGIENSININKRIKQKICNLELSANNLLKQAKNLRNNLKSTCKHGEYTNKFFGKECEPCGSPKVVLCDIKANGRKSHSSKECNNNTCEFFTLVDDITII